MSAGNESQGILLTVQDVRAMEDACAKLAAEIDEFERRRREAEERRDQLTAKLGRIRALIDELGLGARVAAAEPAAHQTTDGQGDDESVDEDEGRPIRGAWPTAILEVLGAGPYLSLTYPEIRTALLNGPMGSRLAESEKGYHNALSRLQKKGLVIRERDRLFLPEGHAAYLGALERGEVNGAFVEAHRPSPMADAILAFVSEAGKRTSSREIVGFLLKDQRFAGTVGRNTSAAFNVLSRLVQRGQLIRGDGEYSLPQTNEAPAHAEASQNPSLGDQTGAD